MTFTKWIQKQYDKGKILNELPDVELLRLVSRFKGLAPSEFIESIVKTELYIYQNDLRFIRWLENEEAY